PRSTSVRALRLSASACRNSSSSRVRLVSSRGARRRPVLLFVDFMISALAWPALIDTSSTCRAESCSGRLGTTRRQTHHRLGNLLQRQHFLHATVLDRSARHTPDDTAGLILRDRGRAGVKHLLQ